MLAVARFPRSRVLLAPICALVLVAASAFGPSPSAGAVGSRAGAVAPTAVPAPPEITSVKVAAHAATVTWTDAADPTTAPITAYGVTTLPEGGTPSTQWIDGTAQQLTVSGLTNGTNYRFQVIARNDLGDSDPSEASALRTVRAAGSLYVPIRPCRLYDSRTSGEGPVAPAQPRRIAVTGRCGIPSGSFAIEASVTAVAPPGSGYLRAYPTSYPDRLATFLNYAAHQSTTNTGTLTFISDAPQGMFLRTAGTPTHVVVDVSGYFIDAPVSPPGLVYVPTASCRALDTRSGGAAARLQRDAPREVKVSNLPGCDLPATVSAVQATVTAVDPSAGGYLRAYPSGTSTPGATFLNYGAHRSIGGTGAIETSNLQADGSRLTLRTYGGPTHVVVDITGYYVPPSATVDGAAYVPWLPCRLYDSRSGGGGGPLAAGTSREVKASGHCFNEHPHTVAVQLAITAVSPDHAGYLRVARAPVDGPASTFQNYGAVQSTTGAGAVAVGPRGITVRALGGRTDLVVDVYGYYTDGTS